MSLKDIFGIETEHKIRYAVVALGDIAQEAMLPGVEHTGNSEVVAFVTDDDVKARKVGEQYGVTQTCRYDQYDQLLRSGTIDAVYIATPNWRHAEFVIPALQAGIHVLVEKPLEISTEKCHQILTAQQASKAKLMVAYRLHFEPSTLALLRRIRSGELGSVHLFHSTFCQMVSPENHRAQHGDLAGPLLDMGPYPINASRYVFSAEPTAVISAVGVRHPQAGLGDLDDTVAVTLGFPEGRLAQFVVSYFGSALDSYYAVGTKGTVLMSPGFMYGKGLEQEVTAGPNKNDKSYKNTDHFGGEMKYFSDCILNNIDPEPDGEEGLADVRVIEGVFQAIKTGASVQLPPFFRSRRINPDAQEQTLRAQRSPELINASNPGQGTDKNPKN
jgi:predicted dehydrogenase